MPISRLVKLGLLSSAIFIGSTVAVQAQSDLPGCGADIVKKTVIEIIEDNLAKKILGWTDATIYHAQLDWDIDSFSLKYIILADYNETIDRLICEATLHGQRDRSIYDALPDHEKLFIDLDYLEAAGHWNSQNISPIRYYVAQSAEDADYFIIDLMQ